MCDTFANNKCPLVVITENAKEFVGIDFYRQLIDAGPNSLKLLQSKIDKLKKVMNSKKYKRESCISLAELNIVDSKSTSKGDYHSNEKKDDAYLNHIVFHKYKKYVVLSSRVHPGEVPGSRMMDGIIRYLLSKEAEELRRLYIFVIVPMLNPDGVRYGNYRCSLTGHDLNRKWQCPNRYLHPEIYYFKNIIRVMQTERSIVAYCDFHGHFRKNNVFMYGCNYKCSENSSLKRNAQIRIIPLLLSQWNTHFSYKDSEFQLEKDKESTARIVLFKEYGIKYSYTCEATFYGSLCELKYIKLMEIRDYMKVGEDFCKVLLMLRNKPEIELLISTISSYLKDKYSKSSTKIITSEKNSMLDSGSYKSNAFSMDKIIMDLQSNDNTKEEKEKTEENDISSTDSEDNLNMLLKENKKAKAKRVRSITFKQKAQKHKVNDKRIHINESANIPTRNILSTSTQMQVQSMKKRNAPKIERKNSDIMMPFSEQKNVKLTKIFQERKPFTRPKIMSTSMHRKEEIDIVPVIKKPIITRSLACPLTEPNPSDAYIAKNLLFKRKKNESQKTPIPHKEMYRLSIVGKNRGKQPILVEYERLHNILYKDETPYLKKVELTNKMVTVQK